MYGRLFEILKQRGYKIVSSLGYKDETVLDMSVRYTVKYNSSSNNIYFQGYSAHGHTVTWGVGLNSIIGRADSFYLKMCNDFENHVYDIIKQDIYFYNLTTDNPFYNEEIEKKRQEELNRIVTSSVVVNKKKQMIRKSNIIVIEPMQELYKSTELVYLNDKGNECRCDNIKKLWFPYFNELHIGDVITDKKTQCVYKFIGDNKFKKCRNRDIKKEHIKKKI